MVDLFGPVVGENWHEPEIVGGASYRWSGPGCVSRIRCPALGGGRLLLRWVLAFPPRDEAIEGVWLAVDGSPVKIGWVLGEARSAFLIDCEAPPGVRHARHRAHGTDVYGLARHPRTRLGREPHRDFAYGGRL